MGSAGPTLPVAPEPEEEDPWASETLAALGRSRRPERRLARALLRTPSLLIGLLLLAGFGGFGLAAVLRYGLVEQLPTRFAWVVATYPPGPQRAHPFGVMSGLGVDVAHALWLATPWDLALLGSILGLAAAGGTLAGASAGFLRGGFDWLVTGLVDLLLAVPPFFLVVILYLGTLPFVRPDQHLPLFVLEFAFVLWPYYARPVRARALSVSQEPYVESARATGSPPGRTLLYHVLPNSLGPSLAQLPIDVYQVFFVLSVFPFLACYPGSTDSLLSPLPYSNFPEWGNLLAQGVCFGWSILPGANFWWMYLFPALVLLLFGWAIALTADGLGTLFEPEIRR